VLSDNKKYPSTKGEILSPQVKKKKEGGSKAPKSEIMSEIEIIELYRKSKREMTKTPAIIKIFTEEVKDGKMFSLKFFILQIFDITSNLAIFNLIITTEYVTKKLLGYKPINFDDEFLKKISIWTGVSLGL
jgi:hypothetical protein